MSKLVPIHQNVDALVKLAKASNQKAQLALYDRYASKMLAVCRRYIKDLQFAEDVMITGFHKSFQNISKYKPQGSFEAWLRQIMIYECISYLRLKKNKFAIVEIKEYYFSQPPDHISSNLSDHIHIAIDQLPLGCRTVFNLYIIEGYKHKEIATMLDISVGTSKSQLAHARKLLKVQLNNLKSENYGTE